MLTAPKLQFLLREKDIIKISDIYGLDTSQVRRMNELQLLNTQYIRDVLVKYDWDKLTKGLKYLVANNKSYTFKELKLALEEDYKITPQCLNAIIGNKSRTERVYFCRRCGKRISSKIYNSTGGLCFGCHAKTLKL
jgi:hypothetical protein